MALTTGWDIHTDTDDQEQNPAPYREDAGGWMTDDQYRTWTGTK